MELWMAEAERLADGIAQLQPVETIQVLRRLLLVVVMDVEQEPREGPVLAAYDALEAEARKVGLLPEP